MKRRRSRRRRPDKHTYKKQALEQEKENSELPHAEKANNSYLAEGRQGTLNVCWKDFGSLKPGGEVWVQCWSCAKWTHEECTEGEENLHSLHESAQWLTQ